MIGTVRLSNEKIGIEQTNLPYKFEEVALYFTLKTTLHFNIGSLLHHVQTVLQSLTLTL